MRVVEQALGRFGRIDTLINNAGIYIGKPFTAYTLRARRRAVVLEPGGGGHAATVAGDRSQTGPPALRAPRATERSWLSMRACALSWLA